MAKLISKNGKNWIRLHLARGGEVVLATERIESCEVRSDTNVLVHTISGDVYGVSPGDAAKILDLLGLEAK